MTRTKKTIALTCIGMSIGLAIGLTSLSSPSFADSKQTGTTQTVTTGGRFMLKDHTGRVRTDQDFQGKFMLLYFGYTYCPDICPTSLQTITHALDLLGKDADIIQPVFISVDPERDTVAVLRDYVGAFHPRLIGLTGSQVAINSVAKKFRVKFAKVADAGGINDDYVVDHTSSVFLMGIDGKFVTRFSHATTAKQMAAKLREYTTKIKIK